MTRVFLFFPHSTHHLSLTVLETLRWGRGPCFPPRAPREVTLPAGTAFTPLVCSLLPTLARLGPRVLQLSHVTEKGLESRVTNTQPHNRQAELGHKGALLCFTLGETEALWSPPPPPATRSAEEQSKFQWLRDQSVLAVGGA